MRLAAGAVAAAIHPANEAPALGELLRLAVLVDPPDIVAGFTEVDRRSWLSGLALCRSVLVAVAKLPAIGIRCDGECSAGEDLDSTASSGASTADGWRRRRRDALYPAESFGHADPRQHLPLHRHLVPLRLALDVALMRWL